MNKLPNYSFLSLYKECKTILSGLLKTVRIAYTKLIDKNPIKIDKLENENE